jgi:2-hydroxy-3-keto-5-methylthiopentenyl-1-phosphate phosphatase
VFVGDGASDRKAVLLADVVFAKGHLADWCEAADVAYRPFATLADVQRGLGL